MSEIVINNIQGNTAQVESKSYFEWRIASVHRMVNTRFFSNCLYFILGQSL